MDAQARYDELADDLAARHVEVELGKMFGMPCVKAGGKAIAGFFREAMVFKLTDAAEHARALELDGAELFDPSERGRRMKAWIGVPAAHAVQWARLAELSVSRGG